MKELAWSPDGTALIVGDRPGTLWHIDPDTGVLTKIYACRSNLGRLATTREAKLVAVSDGDRILMLKRQYH